MKHIVLIALAIMTTACTTTSNNKTLVAYFSATGTTKAVAEQIAQVAQADLFEIEPTEIYTAADLDWRDSTSRSSVEMNDLTSRPAIARKVENLSQYETVYIGFPIWWYTAPTIINTFIEENDLKGKTVLFFATSGGSGIEKACYDFRKAYPDLVWNGGRLLNSPTEDDIKAFVEIPMMTQHVSVNGTTLAYETLGEGRPVLLIHGNGGSHHDLNTLAHQLAEAGYKVYAPDSRGQGANPPLDEYHYADMAEDMFEFCQSLGIEKPIVYGWSDGGIIALMLELAHPGTTSVMVVSGANIFPGKRIDEMYGSEFFADIDISNPLDALMLDEPDIEAEALGAISCPVLVTAGSNDLIPEPHTELIANSIPQGKLMILPDEDHFSYIVDSRKIGEIMLEYLKTVE